MDFATQYCPDRKSLEENVWVQVSRLSGLTARLLGLIGKNHHIFTLTQTACSDAKANIVDCRRLLSTHRSAHGC